MPDIDIKKFGLYLVEGTVTVESDRVVVKSEDSDGNLMDFDPIPVLRSYEGKEIRLVIVPLTSVVELENLAKDLD
jgi:hypothetical protein